MQPQRMCYVSILTIFFNNFITFFQNYIKKKYNLDTKNDSEYYDQNLVKLEIYFKNHGVTYVKEHSAYTVYYCLVTV